METQIVATITIRVHRSDDRLGTKLRYAVLYCQRGTFGFTDSGWRTIRYY